MEKLEEEKLDESAVSTPPSTAVAEGAAPDTIEKLGVPANEEDLEKRDETPPVRNIHGWKVFLVLVD